MGNKNPDIGHVIATTLESIMLAGDINTDALIHTEGGGKMFDLIDLILAERTKESINLMRRILETTNPAEFLPSLIGLLRSHLYIKFLAKIGKDGNEIGNIIKVHPFVLKKSLVSKIRYERLAKLFQEIVTANKAYKSGK